MSACRKALAGFAEAILKSGTQDFAVALVIHEYISAEVTGWAAPGPSGSVFEITAVSAGAPDLTETYLVQRAYPFGLIQSDIYPKDLDFELGSGLTALRHTPENLRRGSALLDPPFLKNVARTTAAMERFFSHPVELRWARLDSGGPIILDTRSSADLESDAGPFDPEGMLEGAESLLYGGETAQSGISAGKVVHVSVAGDFETFPHGAVAVTRTASPQLSPILRKACAIITETGNSISHLATIARELRVPAIFGATGALDLLPEGCEVTVDAGERTVYRGIVKPLLDSRAFNSDLSPSDPEYIVLRLLLRLILPLNLLDPEAADFAAGSCRTYHDIIHFCHERSVEELLHLQERHRKLEGLIPRRLESGVPMEIYVLDVESGVVPGSGASVGLEELTSEPFEAFIRGLVFKEMWERSPASLRFRDIFSGLDKTFAAMSRAEYSGPNLAVVAHNYMNLALHLGYHFSVIDSYIGDNANQNYIYFRFVGGFADDERRRRRAELIRLLLEGMDFKVTVRGDLIVGKFKTAERSETAAVLARLGQLTAFTRQLDTSMTSEASVEEFARLFLLKSESGRLTPEEVEAGHA